MENKLLLVKFKKKHRCFKKGATIEFKNNTTLLVGDQGVGKSTLLKALQNFNNYKDTIAVKTSGEVSTLFFDTEKDNPRVQPGGLEKDALYRVSVAFVSHGETILPLMEHITTEKNRLIMIDEPESGLSIRSQYKLVGYFNKAVENGCQLLVATHSMAIIESYREVFNLEIMKYQSSQDFVNIQKKIVSLK